MFSKTIRQGSKVVRISANDAQGPFTSRLYVNGGETATLLVKKATTLKGAEKQAKALLTA